MAVLVLGSNSPRRKELLEKAGFTFTVRASDVDESISGSLSPEQAVLQLSQRKSEAVPITEDEVLLTADTVVAQEGRILGKPQQFEEAKEYLQSLSGMDHQVFTAVTIRNHQADQTSFVVPTSVSFFRLTEEEIAEYLHSGEAWDKAGGYGIQGKGALFVESIRGDYYSVVGLPISRVVRELRAFDIFPV